MRYSFLFLLVIVFFASLLPVSAQTLTLVKDIATSGSDSAYPRYLTPLNDKLYFSLSTSPGKLFVSDGTAAGTTVIGPSTGNGTIWELTAFNGELYFAYDDGVHGQELWKSDGTPAGTVLVKDLNAGSGSSLPRYFTVCKDKLFFQASTPARSEGLWVTDGTAAGTTGFNVYASPIGGSIGIGAISYQVFNDQIYFSGNTGSGYGLWKSDGTVTGTQVVKAGYNSSYSWVVNNGKMYFGFNDNAGHDGLWESDGTPTGTTFIKAVVNPHDLFSYNNRIYFGAYAASSGDELWTSDGTDAGTLLLKDILPGTTSSTLRNMLLYKNELYFFLSNGEFYKTDGTSSGTVQIIGPGNYPNQTPFLFNGKLYWFDTAGSLNGVMYESDGTVAGTKQIQPQISVYSNRSIAAVFNSELYLSAYFGSQGVELCKLTFPSATLSITSQPTSQAVCPEASASFTTAATGTTNLKYQWQKWDGAVFNSINNGGSYSGATTMTLVINPSNNTTAGTYRCRITGDNAPDAITNTVTLSIANCSQNLITITSQPQPQVTCSGAAATFTTAATGITQFTYQWQKLAGTDFNNIIDGGNYAGTTTSSLRINPSDVTTSGTYRCKVAGDNAAAVFTNSVTLTVSNCSVNTPPQITSTRLAAAKEEVITIDLLSIISDVDGNLNPSSMAVAGFPLSGAPASVSGSGVLTINYSGIVFSGLDELTIQACDFSGSCTQQVITVQVIDDVFVYNAISPNGDGKNEFLFLENIDLLESTRKNKVTIFNRWGDVVFEVNDYNNTDRVFNGLNNAGKELVTGTYYYKITYPSGAASKTGFLYLKR